MEAAGTGPFLYQLLRDGETLTESGNAFFSMENVDQSYIGDYEVVILNEVGEARSGPFLLEVSTRFSEWADENLPEGAPRDPMADPFGNGLGNLLAYALDAGPGAGREAFPVAEVIVPADETGRFLTITYPQIIGARDIRLIPEVSDNLMTWHPLQGRVVSRVRDGNREIITMRDDMPADQATVRFLRLRVEKKEP